MSYKVGDTVRIKRTDGSTSIARITETSVRYVKEGTNTVTSKTLDESTPLGTKVKDKTGNVYIASKVYTVVILDKENDFAETKLTKTIIGSDILGHEIIVHYDPKMLAAFLDLHKGPDFAATSRSSNSSSSSSSSKSRNSSNSSKSRNSSKSSKSSKSRVAKKGGKRTYKRRNKCKCKNDK